MRRQLGIVFAAVLYYCGLVRLCRWLTRRSGRRLIILNYHQATGGDLQSHLLYLRRHYRILHLEEALNELYGLSPVQTQDKRTLLALTFDDGYHDNYTCAFKLACELQVPITIFLVPGYLESGEVFWWRVGNLVVEYAGVELEGHTYFLSQKEDCVRLVQLVDNRVRTAPTVAQREAFLTNLRQALVIGMSGEKPDRPLTWEEVLKMQESGWVSFGGHTMHHPVLMHLSDPKEIYSEVADCRSVLEQHLGCSVYTFAYPIGKTEDIGEEAVKAVRKAGYKWAATTIQGVNTPESDPYLLKRVASDVSRHWLVMAAETSGLWDYISPLWKLVIGR